MINDLKWLATATLIIGSFINSAGFYPLGPLILILGGIFWLVVAVLWKEPALIVTNTFMVAAGIIPLVWRVFG